MAAKKGRRSKSARKVRKRVARATASTAAEQPLFVTSGTVEQQIDVRLSYRIIELFSDGLYSSANKAFEELVTNGFDAGARNVHVMLPPDPRAPGATTLVADDGSGMNALGLEQLWQIGVSQKRKNEDPQRRKQVGKFGIGKLATYVLADCLTYVCKRGGKYYATTMDYRRVDEGVRGEVAPTEPLSLDLRLLTSGEAKRALEPWTTTKVMKAWPVKLFGTGAAKTWTVAILSSLKDKASEIEPGRLKWILSTALPLRDDFSIYMDGKALQPSKTGRGRVGKWVLGKEIKELSKPAPDGISIRKDEELDKTDEKHFGLYHPQLGRITGYAEGYKDALTAGKSAEFGRSYGFFVYVRNRLVNIEDEYFGIDSNLLRHGTFARFRMVVHIDKLDDELRSNREAVRDGPLCNLARDVLHAIFNAVRPRIQEAVEGETSAGRMARKIAGSPASLSRRPIVELARLALEGAASPLYTSVPQDLPDEDREKFVEALVRRSETPEDFVTDVEVSFSLRPEDGLAVFDAGEAVLQINALHPFVAAFLDDFKTSSRSLPLDLLAMAEVLLEAQLYYLDFKESDIEEVLRERDELLRYLASSSGKKTAMMVSQELVNARNSQNELEVQLVASFEKLGYESIRLGGSGKADGRATAHLGADESGVARAYSISLEAKSKVADGTKVSAKSVGISTIVRQRNQLQCQHAVVVGPDFPTTKGDQSALATEIAEDRGKYDDELEAEKRTITLIRIRDLAKLVRLAPLKQITPSKLRELFLSSSMPEEAADWIEDMTSRTPKRPPYKRILETIWQEQKDEADTPVEYGALRVGLKNKNVRRRNDELRELCKAMEAMAPGLISARDNTVEMEVAPDRILDAIESATHDLPLDEQDS